MVPRTKQCFSSKYRGREKEIIKVISVELDDIKRRYDYERMERQELQGKLDNLMSVQDTSTLNLLTANEASKKLRLDNQQKSDQIAKFQKELSAMEDRMKQLELRASDVDQTEIALETTKKALEINQNEYRQQERRLCDLNEISEDRLKKLNTAEAEIRHLGSKVNDLNQQVRSELLRNDRIERETEALPLLKEELTGFKKMSEHLQNELKEKTALLAAARKTAAELRDHLKYHENRESSLMSMKQELTICQQEVVTLKRFLAAKDCVGLQKTRALELATKVIKTLQSKDSRDGPSTVQLINQCSSMIQHVLHRVEPPTPNCLHDRTKKTNETREEFVYSPKSWNTSTDSTITEKSVIRHSNDSPPDPRFAPFIKFKPTIACGATETRPKRLKSAQLSPYLARYLSGSKPVRIRPQTAADVISSPRKLYEDELIEERTSRGSLTRDGLETTEQISAALLRIGDRVRVIESDQRSTNSKGRDQILQRYGKFKDRVSDQTTGAIVKYIDDPQSYTPTSSILIGLRLDNQRYDDFTSGRHSSEVPATFIPIGNVISLFDTHGRRYVSMRNLAEKYVKLKGRNLDSTKGSS